MKLVTTLEQQTVFDLALQEYGSAEAVFDLLLDNSTLTLDTELISGRKLVISRDPSEVNVVNNYIDNSIKPGNAMEAKIQVLGTSDGKAVLTSGGKYIKIKIKK